VGVILKSSVTPKILPQLVHNWSTSKRIQTCKRSWRFSKRVIALWFARKLLTTKAAVRLALDGLDTVIGIVKFTPAILAASRKGFGEKGHETD
jgi:hypothetical protein